MQDMLCFPTQKLCLKVRLRAKCCVLHEKRLWVGAEAGGVRRRLRLWSPMVAYALARWWRGVIGDGIAGFHGGPVLLGNLIASGYAQCYGGFQVVLGCGWWRCVIGAVIRGFRAFRWCWVADGGAVLGGSACKELQIAL